MDRLGRDGIPFLFVVPYDKSEIYVKQLSELEGGILYKLEDWRNYPPKKREKPYGFLKFPAPFETYKKKLEKVLEEIRSGNTYLTNLTCKTLIETDLSLEEIFHYSRAKFKLYFKDQFVCFSPECFIEIEGNSIATYPMKGTIDANLPDAKRQILDNKKEMAEHVMIVDLMRNDLGIVGSDVRVEKFRYVEKVRAGEKCYCR